MKKVNQYSLCRHDFYLAAVLAAAAAVLLVLFLFMRGDTQGDVAVITVQGKVYGTYSLNDEQDILIDTELGHNKVHIANGEVSMEEADCPDGYCISKGAITRNKDTIVCLPHRVVVEVRYSGPEDAASDDAYDIISQ